VKKPEDKRADQVGIAREALLAERKRRRRVQKELAEQRRERGMSLEASVAEISRRLPNIKGDRR